MNRFELFNDEELWTLEFLLRTNHEGSQRDLYAEAAQEQSRREALRKPIIIGLSGIDAPPVR